jgi:DNA-binding LytR/AlgR family response regulator
MKWKCIIVDDEPVARKVLEEYIADIDYLELSAKAENPLKARSLLGSGDIDIMFLDINMPKMNGIEFLKTSPALPLTIMTSAYSDYALESFELNVLDYLVKPFAFERFLKACNKARDYIRLLQKDEPVAGTITENYFFVKCNGIIEKVHYEDLIWVEARQNYVVLHTESRKLIVYLTMKSISEQLPGRLFLKIHKSTIINVSRVRSIEGNVINLDTCSVVISQNLYEEVMKKVLKGRMIKR